MPIFLPKTTINGIENVVEDTTPQLGGTLDANGENITNIDSIYINEQAAADPDTAGKGQFWVRNDAPCVPMFTNDVGTDYELLDPTPTSIVPNQALLADHEAFGIKGVFDTAETSAFGEVCFINSSGAAELADADAAGESPAVMLSLGATHPASAQFLMIGFAEDATWNWTVGGKIYLSDTPGAMTQTAPTTTGDVVQVLGVATHADRIWFNPSLDTIVHA